MAIFTLRLRPDTLKIWMQYLAVIVAAFPAGILGWSLKALGMSEVLSLGVAVLICLTLSYLFQRILGHLVRGTVSAAKPSLSPLMARPSYTVHGVGREPNLAGSAFVTLLIISAATSVTVTVTQSAPSEATASADNKLSCYTA